MKNRVVAFLIKKITRTICATTLFMLSFFTVTAQSNEKPKAVSLDYCADQFLLSIADKDQIIALTEDAIEDHSFYRDKAKDIPLFKATSEQVLRTSPEIVVRYWGGFKMLPLLERANISVVSAIYGTGQEILYDNMRRIGQALKQQARTEQLIQNNQLRFQAVKEKAKLIRLDDRKFRTAYLTPGGITAGMNTFVADVMQLTGLKPLAEELGIEGWRPLPLETLINNPPDLIIGSFFDMGNLHISNWSLTRHHRIRKMIDDIPTIMVPGRYLSCNGIFSVDAAEYIQAELEKIITTKKNKLIAKEIAK